LVGQDPLSENALKASSVSLNSWRLLPLNEAERQRVLPLVVYVFGRSADYVMYIQVDVVSWLKLEPTLQNTYQAPLTLADAGRRHPQPACITQQFQQLTSSPSRKTCHHDSVVRCGAAFMWP
jgi:hypothetical protein